ncbi:MAG TPA: hypothetical protein PLN14_07630 [Candidatus Hydrothermia bacterium]|nr:hypothetical protein [Candidatus Hydrothermia bacterium]
MDKVEKALARLERFQLKKSWNVRVTEKDYEAVTIVAEYIIRMVPSRYHDCILPRGYYIVTADYDLGQHKFLCKDHSNWNYQEFESKPQYLNGGVSLHYGTYTSYPRPVPDVVIEFAKDLYTGLLSEIAEWLDERTAEENEILEEFEKKLKERRC